jgi:hypothetical protein
VKRLAVAGDLTVTDSVLDGIRGAGAEAWFGPLAHAMFPDVAGVVCNLEAAAVDAGEPAPGKVVLASGKAAIEALRALKVVAATLANNHVLDWGWSGAAETARAIESAGVATTGLTGGGPGSGPVRLAIDGWSVGVLAYADETSGALLGNDARRGVRPLDPERAADEVSTLAREVDSVVVSVHGGLEQIPYPEPHLTRTFRLLAEAGAALVFGHHPHCLRGMERHRGSWLAYGLGNFVTPDHRATKDGRPILIPRLRANRVGAVLVVEPESRGRLNLVDVRFAWTARSGRTTRLGGRKAAGWKRRVEALSVGLGGDEYAAFQAREAARAGRVYRLKIGLIRGLRTRPRWSQLGTAWRLMLGRS